MAESLRERRAQLARDEAVEATVRLLEESDDADAVSMAGVAAAAGLSLRTLYRYFPTRDALLREAGARVQGELALPIAVRSAAEIPASFWAASARLAKRPQLARALVRSTAGRAAHQDTRGARVEAIRTALNESVADLPPERAQQIAGVIAHLCSSTAWVSIADESHLSATDARRGVRWALETLLAALAEKENTMSMEMTCGPCGTVITGEDEDDLVIRVQEHAREHDGAPNLSREHILAHLHGENPEEPPR